MTGNMKKLLSLFLLILFVAGISVADGQGKYKRYMKGPQPKFGYGIKAGLNLANQKSPGGDAGVVVKYILGINAGGYCHYFFDRHFAIQTELMVSGKGSNWKDFYYNKKDMVTYIDLPLLVRFQPVKYLNFYAGPQASYKVSASQKDIKEGITADISDYYKPFDFGLVLGAEVNLTNRLNITARYIVGLTPATTEEYNTPWYNNYFQFSVGFRLAGR
jgi:hypothetical protein